MQTLTRLLLHGWSGFAFSSLQLASCHHQAKSQYSIKLTYEKYKQLVINIWGNTAKIPVVDWNTLQEKGTVSSAFGFMSLLVLVYYHWVTSDSKQRELV